MSNFDNAYKRTINTEGGYANDPRDRGGETYKGVSRNNWPRWSGWRIVDGVKNNLVKQPPHGTPEYRNWVRELNRQLAGSPLLQNAVMAFYKNNFWGNLGEITDQRVAEELFDKRVNCGDVACRWIQRAAAVVADGTIGPKSLAAINAADPAALLSKFNDAAFHYYEGLIRVDSSQAVFRNSWYGRLKNYDGSQFDTEGVA
ncbi:MAG: glycosyl hydrolase 108 family protein [Desulfuromonadaceae bacterium]|nr:glycosyl hydrolase 108 family protein [Desulfuromonadaceae bacterium]